MTIFLSDYISYIQESRVKAAELDYYEMNQYFWRDVDSSHWREKRASFYRNHEAILHELDSDVDGAWGRQIRNFIARDNLFHFLPRINQDWVSSNVDMLGFEAVSASLVRSRPVVFLSFHNFYQVLVPMIIAQYVDPVSSFVLDEDAEGDRLIQTYMAEMYKGMEQGLNGGSLLKVGAGKSDKAKRDLEEILERRGCVYAAIDMVHPQLGGKTKHIIQGDLFEFEVLAGIVDAGLEQNAQFVFPFISLVRNGRLRFEMFNLSGSTAKEVLSSYQKVFDSIILRDVSVWEGASLLSYKDCRFS